MTEVLVCLDKGIPVAIPSDGGQLRAIAEAALQLQAGLRTSHPELFLFKTWGEVQDYAEHDSAGQDLRAIVQLVDTHGAETIISALSRLSAERDARVTVSTVHKAKGREWPSVRIGPGFEFLIAREKLKSAAKNVERLVFVVLNVRRRTVALRHVRAAERIHVRSVLATRQVDSEFPEKP